MSSVRFSLIAAFSKQNRGIGFQNKLPWHFKEDMEHFKRITIGAGKRRNAVIMGRNTWESLPPKQRPLPNRENYIISRRQSGKNIFFDFNDALEMCKRRNQYPFVIGGAQLYKSTILRPNCESIYVTEIDGEYECDTFFPSIPKYFGLTSEERRGLLTFKKYENWSDPTSEEKQYLALLDDILENGEDHSDRTGTGIKSVFGRQMRFSIRDGVLPLMTTKKTFFRGIVEELLFFMRGDHDNRKLQMKDVHIWNGNTSREGLDKNGRQHLETHDLGLAYGVQWRAAGAKLGNIHTDYRGKGVDQLQQVIELLKSDPHSRRIIINAWNVSQLKDMALPPCHAMYQFYVSNNELSCLMFQRSVDVFLGNPFNIASTALLTHILAKTAGLKTGEIVISMGNTHIYNNHIDQVNQQLRRNTLRFPTIQIKKDLNSIEDIEALQFDDFVLEGYHSWPGIKADMAV